ncbi:Na+/H+ antiporter NhaC family protein [Alkalicoccus chagannorensis]|uniref:Na+/H+ antiporter NhaC family protein n=1 Tax=Alkalicoccus chagannorensis TaxID=427072 RepID=UPI000478D4A4|nr:Na+/H+ antiporter NhaC family protein [Alkalicoccus chagannorensis]
MTETIWSLLPPVLALVLVLVTRRVLISLGAGIVAGALMIHAGAENVVTAAAADVSSTVIGIFWVDGSVNTWELYILLFLFILGMIAALLTAAGGGRAFGEWAAAKVRTRRGAQYTPAVLGIIIFIDDYFNSLTVGNVSRPLTDRHRVSRAKLAYVVDSTAAPMCVISPVSSWGAYIITIIGGILATHGVAQYGALEAFVLIAPMNFYALLAILVVFAAIFWRVDIGPMRTHEDRAVTKGELTDVTKGSVPGDHQQQERAAGRVYDLLLPIFILLGAVLFFMLWTGAAATEGTAGILDMFENTDVAAALLYGGLISLASAIVIALRRRLTAAHLGEALGNGMKSMLPAVYILLFAWTIIEVIDALGTGVYLADQVGGAVHPGFLPVILFLTAGFMAFSTGTSWGTFAIMLPIAGDFAASVDISLMLPLLAAVLAGSIFGDHCSPISDTTILSSTGAGSHHIDHVWTQLPYAVLTAGASAAAFLLLGFTGSVLLGLAAGTAVALGTLFFLRPKDKPAAA